MWHKEPCFRASEYGDLIICLHLALLFPLVIKFILRMSCSTGLCACTAFKGTPFKILAWARKCTLYSLNICKASVRYFGGAEEWQKGAITPSFASSDSQQFNYCHWNLQRVIAALANKSSIQGALIHFRLSYMAQRFQRAQNDDGWCHVTESSYGWILKVIWIRLGTERWAFGEVHLYAI